MNQICRLVLYIRLKGSSPEEETEGKPFLAKLNPSRPGEDNTCYPSPGKGLLEKEQKIRPVPSSRIPLTECKGVQTAVLGLAGGGPGIGHRLGEKEGPLPF